MESRINTIIIVRTPFGAIEFFCPCDLGHHLSLNVIIGGQSFKASYNAFKFDRLAHIYSVGLVHLTQLEHNRLLSLANIWLKTS